MALEIIRNGIYSLNGFNPYVNGCLVLAVHPYFRGFYKRNYKNKNYIPRLEELIENYKRPIITLEQHSRLNQTSERYLFLGRSLDTYFIPTMEKSPDPYELRWEEVISFLKEFKITSIHLVGGYFHGDHGGGCLGETVRILKERSGFPVGVIKKITF